MNCQFCGQEMQRVLIGDDFWCETCRVWFCTHGIGWLRHTLSDKPLPSLWEIINSLAGTIIQDAEKRSCRTQGALEY